MQDKKVELTKKALSLLFKNNIVTIVYKNTMMITTGNKKMITKIINKDYEEIEYIRWKMDY